MKKTVLKGVGYTAVGLGFAGAFLPLLPTTPFLLLAAWCFSKSSPRMNAWLLKNRFCGRYIRDYRSGAGVPPQVKTASILMLWGGMSFSAIVFVERGWVQALLYLIAAATTVHILRIRSGRKGALHIFVPTEAEIAPFLEKFRGDVRVSVCGVGAIETMNTLQRVLGKDKPRLAILAGIAGAYPLSGLTPGDCVAVRRERCADLGSFSEGSFQGKFTREYLCPERLPAWLREVTSNSVNAAATPYLGDAEAEIENMEGAAFFAFCLQNGIPFQEIRAISNTVGEPFPQWDTALAARRLAETLNRLTDETDA